MSQIRRSTRFDYFLASVCVLSLSLNFVLLFLINRPDLLSTVRLSFKRAPSATEKDHIRGTVGASVTAIEYSDFLCHFCKEQHAILKTLSDSHKITWIFRNRPLDAIHPLATKAAIAAECADQQGKFWEYADSLFEDQAQITSQGAFADLARRLNLDEAAFSHCQASDVESFVHDQADKAAALEINATPTLFIDGKRYTGALPLETLSQIVAQKRE